MVRDNNAIAAMLHGQPGVIHMLNTLENDGTIPVLAQQRQLLPSAWPARERLSNPCPGCPDNIIFDFVTRLLLELGAENGITKSHLVSDTTDKRYIGIVQITWSPGQGERVQGDYQGREPIIFSTLQQGNSDIVIFRPVKLEPSFPIAVRGSHLFDCAAARRAENIRYPGFCANLRKTNLLIFVE